MSEIVASLAILALLGILVWTLYENRNERARHSEQLSEMCDRFMARDYSEFVDNRSDTKMEPSRNFFHRKFVVEADPDLRDSQNDGGA